MRTVDVRQLESNPSDALIATREDRAVVMNRDNPRAVIVDLPNTRSALAAALPKSRSISAGRAARVRQRPLAEMPAQFPEMGISLIEDGKEGVATALSDIETGCAWPKANEG